MPNWPLGFVGCSNEGKESLKKEESGWNGYLKDYLKDNFADEIIIALPTSIKFIKSIVDV